MGKRTSTFGKAWTQLKFGSVAILVVAGGSLHVASSPYQYYPWLILGFAFAIFLSKQISRFAVSQGKHVNTERYVVLSASNELEHRQIAKELLNRALERNEVVHHINGNKTDNHVRNLCLMDREKHEQFHAWLSWKKNKSGQYPSFKNQKRLLEAEYGGILLEKIRRPKKVVAAPPLKFEGKSTRTFVPAVRNEPNSEMQRKLFVKLRNERTRIAEERKIPAYLIFHDKTLIEMSESMPDSKHAMLEVSDVGPEKYEIYGAYFIAVIWKFKAEFNLGFKGKKDPA